MANVEQAASVLKVKIFYSKGGGSFIQNLSTCVTNLHIPEGHDLNTDHHNNLKPPIKLQQTRHCTH